MAGQISHQISITMNDNEIQILKAIKGSALLSIEQDDLVGCIVVVDLVTAAGCIRVRNLQYEQPLREDGMDYPVLSAEKVKVPIEGSLHRSFNDTIRRVSVIRKYGTWKKDKTAWHVECDAALCIDCDHVHIFINIVDSPEGALRCSTDTHVSDPEKLLKRFWDVKSAEHAPDEIRMEKIEL